MSDRRGFIDFDLTPVLVFVFAVGLILGVLGSELIRWIRLHLEVSWR
jgi:hypothetical protein